MSKQFRGGVWAADINKSEDVEQHQCQQQQWSRRLDDARKTSESETKQNKRTNKKLRSQAAESQVGPRRRGEKSLFLRLPVSSGATAHSTLLCIHFTVLHSPFPRKIAITVYCFIFETGLMKEIKVTRSETPNRQMSGTELGAHSTVCPSPPEALGGQS